MDFDTGSGIGWLGVLMAALSMLRGELAAMTARQVAKDKLEFEQKVARDKLEYDAKLTKLSVDHESCTAHQEQTAAALEKCEKSHQELLTKMSQSECDRAELRGQLAVLMKVLPVPKP